MMRKTNEQKYFFQKRKINFTQKIFKKGLNTAGYILLGLKEIGKDFLVDFTENLPRRDSRIAPTRALLLDLISDRTFRKKDVIVNLRRLRKDGLIRKSEKEKVYYLTDKGEEIVTYIKSRYFILKKSWDRKIRMIVFDIPEEKRYLRKWLRQELLLMQYKCLQKSVYLGKYPLPDDFYQELIKNGIFENVYVFIIDQVDKKKQISNLLES